MLISKLVVQFAYFTEIANTREVQPTPAGIQPIRDQRQSHSVYNGDVSDNQNEGLRGKKYNKFRNVAMGLMLPQW